MSAFVCSAGNYSYGLSCSGEGSWRIHFRLNRKKRIYFRSGVALENSLSVSENERVFS